MKYIAYYRVSTRTQGASGLGLEAQKEQVLQHMGKNPGELIGEFTEIESGKNNNRSILAQAIEQCRNTGATLLIAKLDRLSRNASFIFALRDSTVNFVCCDLPDMNTLTIGIFAVMAQHERELTSKRTKEALAAKKAKFKPGQRFGNPNGFLPEALAKALEQKNQNFINSSALKKALHVVEMHKANLDTTLIVNSLRKMDIRTPRGKEYNTNNVRTLMKYYNQNV